MAKKKPRKLKKLKNPADSDLPQPLRESKLWKKVWPVAKKAMLAKTKEALKPKGRAYSTPGPPKDEYAIAVLMRLIDLSKSIYALANTVAFLTIKKVPKHYLDNGIEESDYYRIHFENHIVRMASVEDYCLRLVNFIMRLGYPEKQANSLIDNLKIKGTPIAVALKDLDRFLQTIKAHRNVIVHQGAFESEEISSLTDNIVNFDGKDYEPLAEWFNDRRKEALTKLIRTTRDRNRRIVEFLAAILDTLDGDFHQNHKML